LLITRYAIAQINKVKQKIVTLPNNTSPQGNFEKMEGHATIPIHRVGRKNKPHVDNKNPNSPIRKINDLIFTFSLWLHFMI
jgi:hypothetical protein